MAKKKKTQQGAPAVMAAEVSWDTCSKEQAFIYLWRERDMLGKWHSGIVWMCWRKCQCIQETRPRVHSRHPNVLNRRNQMWPISLAALVLGRPLCRSSPLLIRMTLQVAAIIWGEKAQFALHILCRQKILGLILAKVEVPELRCWRPTVGQSS